MDSQPVSAEKGQCDGSGKDSTSRRVSRSASPSVMDADSNQREGHRTTAASSTFRASAASTHFPSGFGTTSTFRSHHLELISRSATSTAITPERMHPPPDLPRFFNSASPRKLQRHLAKASLSNPGCHILRYSLLRHKLCPFFLALIVFVVQRSSLHFFQPGKRRRACNRKSILKNLFWTFFRSSLLQLLLLETTSRTLLRCMSILHSFLQSQ